MLLKVIQKEINATESDLEREMLLKVIQRENATKSDLEKEKCYWKWLKKDKCYWKWCY